jgi:hypothetical protein
MDAATMPYLLVVVILAGIAVVAWFIGLRYFSQRPAELSPKERAFGFLLAGPFFGPLHSSLSARGYKLSVREKSGLAFVIAIVLVAIIGSLVFGYGVRGA